MATIGAHGFGPNKNTIAVYTKIRYETFSSEPITGTVSPGEKVSVNIQTTLVDGEKIVGIIGVKPFNSFFALLYAYADEYSTTLSETYKVGVQNIGTNSVELTGAAISITLCIMGI